METAFDVSGSIKFADVARPKANETAAQRLTRLAQKATIEGCVVYWLQGTEGLAAVTSGRIANAAYTVDIAHGTCSCQAGTKACKHKALVLSHLGALPDPAVYHDRAAVLREVGRGDGERVAA